MTNDLAELIAFERKKRERAEYIQTSTGPVVVVKMPKNLRTGVQDETTPKLVGGLIELFDYQALVMEVKKDSAGLHSVIVAKLEPYDPAKHPRNMDDQLTLIAEIYPALDDRTEVTGAGN